MRNYMFKIAKLAAFSRKNARSLYTVDKLYTMDKNWTLWTNIGLCGQKLHTAVDKNCTLWTKIAHYGQKLDTADKNWTL